MTKVSLGRKSPWMENRRILFWCGSAANKSGTFSMASTKKKAAYPDYRKARNEMQELVRAQKNVERFFAEEKETTEKTPTR